MKKIYFILFLLVALGGCKSIFSIALNPGKEAFNSGTIGSVRATDNLPNPNTGMSNLMDTSSVRKEIAHH